MSWAPLSVQVGQVWGIVSNWSQEPEKLLGEAKILYVGDARSCPESVRDSTIQNVGSDDRTPVPEDDTKIVVYGWNTHKYWDTLEYFKGEFRRKDA
jgi:hypothetical protein